MWVLGVNLGLLEAGSAPNHALDCVLSLALTFFFFFEMESLTET